MADEKSLSASQIANILRKSNEPRARGGGRKIKDPTEPRDYATWFKLNHTFGVCENETCLDTREGGGVNGTAMVAVVHEKKSCRYCFLAGWNRPDDSDNA